MTPEQLREYLTFYQDLGVRTVYRRTPVGAQAIAQPIPQETFAPPAVTNSTMTKPAPSAITLPPLAPSDDSMLRIIQDIGDCQRCRLGSTRNKLVFGSGSENAKLVFVGEGPGADEDAQGLPFV